MSSSRIKQLGDLLVSKLGNNKKIVNVQEIDFLQKGENYGSSLFRVDIAVEDEKTGEQEKIYAVAKTLPETDEQKQAFNVQHTVGKEIAFYNVIVPCLKRFLEESNVVYDIDNYPELYGGRLNLNGSDKVDEDSVILFENLIMSGYKNVDRFESFDYATSKMVLKDMAAFHAVPLALRLKNPDLFQREIRCHCSGFFDHRGDEPPPPPPDNSGPEVLIEILYQNDKCLNAAMKLSQKFKKMFDHPPGEKMGPPGGFGKKEGPWHSIAHCDLWVNNLMVKFEGSKPISTKFIDFQNYNYDSCVNDLFFFMWTSIQKDVLEQSFDELLKHYYTHFYDILRKLGCETDPYSYDLFLEEVNEVAKREVMHALFFIMIVFGKKGGNPDGVLPNFKDLLVDLSVPCKEKIWFMVQEFDRRRWIQN